MNHKTFAMAEVKAAPSDSANGEFDIVMSTDSIDRDGESIRKGAFEPLPDSIPVHAFHDFNDPVGRVVPSYDSDGRLVGRGYFAGTARAQEIRQLVADGVIGHTSVGFMAATRTDDEKGVPEVTSGELLEVSFVSVPSNRDAAVLSAKAYNLLLSPSEGVKPADLAWIASLDEKAGARNSSKDAERIQSIHDLVVENGATCVSTDSTTAPEAPSIEDGKSPASNVVEMARIRASIARLSLTD